MKKLVFGIVAGMLVGAIVSPVGAHHRRDNRELRQELTALEDQIDDLESVVSSLDIDVDGIEGEISRLDDRTRNLTSAGEYLGDIQAIHVIKPDGCNSNTAAMWNSLFLDC